MKSSHEQVAELGSLAASRGLVGLVIIVVVSVLLGRINFRLGWPW